MPAPLDPWEIVARNPRLSVRAARLPDGVAGAADGAGQIWLGKRLTAVEQRCVLAHELVHIDAGHHGHQTDAVATWVREQTARRLITLKTHLP